MRYAKGRKYGYAICPQVGEITSPPKHFYHYNTVKKAAHSLLVASSGMLVFNSAPNSFDDECLFTKMSATKFC